MSLIQQFITLFPDGLDGLIFDCDGVLIDSSQVNIGYYNLLLNALGKPAMDSEAEQYVQMASVQEALNYITSPEEQSLLPGLIERFPYKKHAQPLLTLEPEIKEILAYITSIGLRRAVHTNRSAGMQDILKQFDLLGVFDPVMTCALVKPKPDPEGIFCILQQWQVPRTRILFLGDSLTDYRAAFQAQVPFAAYKNTQLDADIHIPSYSVLQQILEEACQIWQVRTKYGNFSQHSQLDSAIFYPYLFLYGAYWRLAYMAISTPFLCGCITISCSTFYIPLYSAFIRLHSKNSPFYICKWL